VEKDFPAMSPFSKEARSHRLALGHDEPILIRAGGPATPRLTARDPALPARGEASGTGATRRTPVLSATVEAARAFELRVGEPAAVASVLTSGGATGPRQGGGFLRKAATAAVAGLALVGAIVIFHSLGLALPL
jgi:hypothetical protein